MTNEKSDKRVASLRSLQSGTYAQGSCCSSQAQSEAHRITAAAHLACIDVKVVVCEQCSTPLSVCCCKLGVCNGGLFSLRHCSIDMQGALMTFPSVSKKPLPLCISLCKFGRFARQTAPWGCGLLRGTRCACRRTTAWHWACSYDSALRPKGKVQHLHVQRAISNWCLRKASRV